MISAQLSLAAPLNTIAYDTLQARAPALVAASAFHYALKNKYGHSKSGNAGDERHHHGSGASQGERT